MSHRNLIEHVFSMISSLLVNLGMPRAGVGSGSVKLDPGVCARSNNTYLLDGKDTFGDQAAQCILL